MWQGKEETKKTTSDRLLIVVENVPNKGVFGRRHSMLHSHRRSTKSENNNNNNNQMRSQVKVSFHSTILYNPQRPEKKRGGGSASSPRVAFFIIAIVKAKKY
jgi:hypothetical protein